MASLCKRHVFENGRYQNNGKGNGKEFKWLSLFYLLFGFMKALKFVIYWQWCSDWMCFTSICFYQLFVIHFRARKIEYAQANHPKGEADGHKIVYTAFMTTNKKNEEDEGNSNKNGENSRCGIQIVPLFYSPELLNGINEQ